MDFDWKYKQLFKNDMNIDLTGEVNIIYYFGSYYPIKFFNDQEIPVDRTYRSRMYWMIRRLKWLKEKGWYTYPEDAYYSPTYFRSCLEPKFDFIDSKNEEWLVVTVPSHDQVSGINNIGALLKTFKQYNNIKYCSDLLLRKQVVPEKKQTNDRTYESEYESLTINPAYNIENKNIILLDDIVTSGTSIKANKTFLLHNKANKVICFSLLRTFDRANDYYEKTGTKIKNYYAKKDEIKSDYNSARAQLILALLKIKGFGADKIAKFVVDNSNSYDKCISSVDNLLSEDQKEDFKLYKEEALKEINQNKSFGISITTIFDKDFPIKLYTGTKKCIYLYYKGNKELLNLPSVAVIGTKNPNMFAKLPGIEITKKLSKEYVIVSGLALGCDTIAHQACLDSNGKTIAVLPSPIFDILPFENQELANRIVNNNGLLVTEYGTRLGNRFVENENIRYEIEKRYIDRDRIQSLLSDAAVVIDADDNSGTRHAVEKCIHDNKLVFQLSSSKMSIIKNKVNSADDIIKLLKK